MMLNVILSFGKLTSSNQCQLRFFHANLNEHVNNDLYRRLKKVTKTIFFLLFIVKFHKKNKKYKFYKKNYFERSMKCYKCSKLKIYFYDNCHKFIEIICCLSYIKIIKQR